MKNQSLIDKLDVKLPPEIPLTTEVESGLALAKKLKHPALYEKGFDLAPLGIPAILQRRCIFGATQKLSIKDTGRRCIREMAAIIEKVFDADPWESRIARVDFALDLPGMPIDLFRCLVRVANKRDCWERRGAGDFQGLSLYIGHTADMFRFYDKHAESRYRSGTALNDGQQPPLTRIERQMRTTRIPNEVSTLSGLVRHGMDFNPFLPLRFAKGGKAEPHMQDYPIRDYLAGMGLRWEIIQHGYARVYQNLNERSKGNATRTMTRLRDFLPPDSGDFCELDLFELYRSSLSRQLTGADWGTTEAPHIQ